MTEDPGFCFPSSLLWCSRNNITKLVSVIPVCCCPSFRVWDLCPRVPNFPVSRACGSSPSPQAGCCNSILIGQCCLQVMKLLEKHSEGCFGMFDWKQDKPDHSVVLCLSFCYLGRWFSTSCLVKAFIMQLELVESCATSTLSKTVIL